MATTTTLTPAPPSLYYICNLPSPSTKQSTPKTHHIYSTATPAATTPTASGRRDWSHLYSIYGLPSWLSPVLLLLSAASSAVASALLLLHLRLPFPSLLAALLSVSLLLAASNLLHSSLSLHWLMCQRVVSSVPDWSSVRTALDLGCGRGILLNSVALQLKKSGSAGRVVGLDRRRDTAVAALRTARAEGVEDYVTCREGDCLARLPFGDGYFDVVVSAVHLSGAGDAERGLGEAVRVLRGGGWGVVWDAGVEGIVRRLRELRMEEIRVSERVLAYLGRTHIVSFRKPLVESSTDWRATLLC